MSSLNKNRDQYGYFLPIQTRWSDNDIYGHVNNVVYYSYFDSAANHFLIQQAGLDIHAGDIVGFVVASQCQYLTPIAYPEVIEVGMRVNKLGNSSVEYGMAIFKQGDDSAAAYGSFTHVFVEKAKNAAVPIPDNIRTALDKMQSQQ